nr:carboxypeptidase regulatory-like domain-containing protein [Pyrinomonadaceae bacterium]
GNSLWNTQFSQLDAKTVFQTVAITTNLLRIRSIVNTSTSPVSDGVVNVRGASTITASGVSTSNGATFNWTDAGSLTSVRKTSLFATSGTLTLGTAGINNAGVFTLNGATANCLEAGDILVRSSASGTARPWTGSGIFILTDVDLQDQNSTPTINVLTGNNSGNNTNFNFNYGPIGTLTYDQTNYNVAEGQSITVTVKRPVSEPCGLPVTVDYATSDGTAIAGTHYTATSGTLSLAQGVMTQTYTITTTPGMGGAGKSFFLLLNNQNPSFFAENTPNGIPPTTVTILAPTAAGSLLKGRLLTSTGRGLSNAQVVLTNTRTGELSYARSSGFGYFTFEDLPTGDLYILEVPSKRFRFNQQSFTLNGDLTDLVLTAQP